MNVLFTVVTKKTTFGKEKRKLTADKVTCFVGITTTILAVQGQIKLAGGRLAYNLQSP